MENSIKKGLGFGLTSGIITTLGSMIGIAVSTSSSRLVLIAVITIALADSLSDAMGMHNVEESEKKASSKNIWLATLYTFVFKFIVAMSFTVPLYLFKLNTAIFISVIWGAILLTIFSIYLAKQRNVSIYSTIIEHIIMAAIVIVCTYLLGTFLEKVI